VKIVADERAWRIEETDDGWRAAGQPEATLTRRTLRADVLTIGADAYTVKGRTVKNLLKLELDKSGRKPVLTGEILKPPPPEADAHATIALAIAALLLGVDLSVSAAHAEINGDNIAAAVHYGLHHP
jgi:hypothetical protein